MVFPLPLVFNLHHLVEDLTMPKLCSLGKLCGSGRTDDIIQDQVMRKNSVFRMSVIEDGNVAQVLYLIPKQSMEQLPFLDPSEYVVLEKMAPPDIEAGKKDYIRAMCSIQRRKPCYRWTLQTIAD